MIRTVTKTEEEFWKHLEGFTPSRSVFEAQGEEHGDIDFRLVEKIEAYLLPKIGPWEQTDRWFHNMDYYGDGIRSLEFAADCFSPDYLPDFQGMLTGEHAEFTILCKVTSDLGESGAEIGSLAIRADNILISYPLVAYFNGKL
jgi:hypothetical protein